MNAKQYYKIHKGTQHLKDVLQKAGTNLPYFQQLSYGVRKPSVDMAKRLEQASNGEMKASDLLGLS